MFSLHNWNFFIPWPISSHFYQLPSPENLVSQSCPTLCDPTDCSPPGFSVHGILQARIPEWVAISFSRGSSWPRDWTRVTHIADRLFSAWAIREDLPIPGDHHYPLCFHEFVLLDSTCKSRITGKQHPDAGKDWGQEERRVTDNEMLGWHQWLGGHEFEQTPGDGEGQGSLACCSPWGHKESDMTYPLNNKQQVRDICFLQYFAIFAFLCLPYFT